MREGVMMRMDGWMDIYIWDVRYGRDTQSQERKEKKAGLRL
jgi:uncharacterized Fe-S radical SAM superfamily protein PflX